MHLRQHIFTNSITLPDGSEWYRQNIETSNTGLNNPLNLWDPTGFEYEDGWPPDDWPWDLIQGDLPEDIAFSAYAETVAEIVDTSIDKDYSYFLSDFWEIESDDRDRSIEFYSYNVSESHRRTNFTVAPLSGGQVDNDNGLTFTATLTMTAASLSPAWSASSSVPIWGQIAMGVVTITSAAYIHANSKNSQKPNIVYEIYSLNPNGFQTMKYGVSSRSDYVTRSGNPRPEYQCIVLNSIAPPGTYYWYSILARTKDRASALSIEKSLVDINISVHGRRPVLQTRP